MISFAEFVKKLREKEEATKNEFERLIHQLKVQYPRTVIVLFGSRAEKRASYMSDYDLLILLERKIQCDDIRQMLEAIVIDLHCYLVDEIDGEVKRFNTIVIDALIRGTCLYDGLAVFDDLQRSTTDKVRTSNLVRTDDGWIPTS